MVDCCKRGNKLSGSTKCREFLVKLKRHWFFNTYCVPPILFMKTLRVLLFMSMATTCNKHVNTMTKKNIPHACGPG